jgi:hypothetical protein
MTLVHDATPGRTAIFTCTVSGQSLSCQVIGYSTSHVHPETSVGVSN